jgi:choline dehydrogenase-like flavoprotein
MNDADVLIVGSGVAGALVAERLARAGARVLIVEAGPHVQRAQAVARFQAALVKVPECAYPEPAYAPHPRVDQPDGYYVQAGPQKFGSTYLRQVGGTTWHWLGTCLRFVPDDFRLRSRFGRGVDWPLQYAALEPWYGEAEHELGVAGDDGDALGSPRSRGYPLPAIPMTYLDQAVGRAFAGTPWRLQATPQARNSRPHADRPPCCGSASCIPVCPIQAKYDATVHLARAQAAGARLLAEHVVHHLEVGPDRRIQALRFKRPDGSEGRLAAKVFVLAAHGIEIPKLLLMSRQPGAPQGVANASGQVGRNLMDHPVQLSWALMPQPVWPFRGPLSTAGAEGPRAGDWRARRPAYRIEVGNDGWAWPTGAPMADAQELAGQGLRGEALRTALRDRLSRQVRIGSLTEQLPDPFNRIEPDPIEKDALGIPRPRIQFRLDTYTRAGLAHARREHQALFERLGATGIRHKEEGQWQGAGHVMGTARMGRDGRHAVVDADLRSFDHPNLFIQGSAVFPTGAAANPTLTIAALALRSVAAMRKALAT